MNQLRIEQGRKVLDDCSLALEQWVIFNEVIEAEISLRMACLADNTLVQQESARAWVRHLIWTLATMFLFVITAAPTGGVPLTDFEKGFGDSAIGSARLRPCLSIEDVGLRAGCSLLAALEVEAAALEGQFAVSEDRCTYRLQGGPSLHKFAAKMHPYLKQVLERYATLHRHCTGLEYDSLGGMYASKKKSPQCRYIVWSCTFGLGNKLMSLLSTFLYAIISQRVLLIESPGWEHLFCEPFPGSKLQV